MLMLHGGGNAFQEKVPSVIDEYVFSRIKKQLFSILYIPFAKDPSERKRSFDHFKEKINAVSGEKEIEYLPLEYDHVIQDRSYVINAIEKANLIYISGGDPKMLIRYFLSLNILSHICDAAKQDNKIVIGKSAGALLFFKYAVSANHQRDCDELIQGTGELPFCCAVHFSQRKRHDVLAKFSDSCNVNGLGIDEEVCLVLTSTGGEIVKNNPGVHLRFYNNTTGTYEQVTSDEQVEQLHEMFLF